MRLRIGNNVVMFEALGLPGEIARGEDEERDEDELDGEGDELERVHGGGNRRRARGTHVIGSAAR